MGKYKVSVIIPLFNQENEIKICIQTLRKQTFGFHNIEVILINDGSVDRSGEICKQLHAKYSNIQYIYQENKGVSSARNKGIQIATGKYIFFLDSDDILEKQTIEHVSVFFDTVYESVDLVSYRIETLYNGRILPKHFRYKYLIESGIYDLCEYAYIGQTTMNIAVKNKFDKNILFDERQTFSEDQKYCCEVLKDTLKMGYCKEGTYIYKRSHNSTSANLSGACYIFEQCIGLFEELFSQYKQVPLAFQGLYVNDIYWKMTNNILFPYHYKKEDYENAIARIQKLLNRCENHVILEHPNIDFFEKYYLLNQKDTHDIRTQLEESHFGLLYNTVTLLREESMELVITKLTYHGETILIDGFIKSAFLQFYRDEIMICAVENDGQLTKKLTISDSMHNYYLSHEKTQNFKAFQYECNPSAVHKVRFNVEMSGRWYPTHYYFMPLVSLSHARQFYSCQKENIKICFDASNQFLFERINSVKEQSIWLYYDCAGIAYDNGYLQFKHDILKKDNVKRYYVITDDRQRQDEMVEKHSVKFGSKKHKKLLAKCKKIITAYIEEANIIPYEKSQYEEFALHFSAEVIYLQHGVLHIIMPWKYTREHLLADKIVVSTIEEAALYQQNGYKSKDLIKTGMPRFEYLKRNKLQKKILFAPSWRRYLVGDYRNNRWDKMEGRFTKSYFYEEISLFLNTESLATFLEKNGYYLEVKLHPIFQMYAEFFRWKSPRISFSKDCAKDSDYDLLITDYSSYSFNFMYLSIPILYFIPDIEEFQCGLNGYRELNYPELFWEEVCTNSKEVIEKIENILLHQADTKKYATFYQCEEISNNIYQKLMEDEREEKGNDSLSI